MTIEKLKQFCYLARWHRPAGLFLIWPMLWALWLAGQGRPDIVNVAIFMLGAIVMRSAGCVINDIADRRIDGYVARTRLRPLVTGKITTQEAFVFFILLISCAFLLVLCLNRLSILLAFAGVFFAIVYPFMKRFTHLPQLGLGVAFSWGVPMAFAAQNNAISFNDWMLFFAAVIWPIIYDTFYAMVDRPDDLKIGVKSTAILFGSRDKYIIAILQSIFLLWMVWVGYLFHLHDMYYVSLVGAAILFFYQQKCACFDDPSRYFKAFLNNHWVGAIIFLGIVLNYENCCR